jgi:hypothetical protein
MIAIGMIFKITLGGYDTSKAVGPLIWVPVISKVAPPTSLCLPSDWFLSADLLDSAIRRSCC